MNKMNKIKKITNARKKIKLLKDKQEEVIHDLMDEIGRNIAKDILMIVLIFDYLNNGTNSSLYSLTNKLTKNGKRMAWWQR